jgi:glucokinase
VPGEGGHGAFAPANDVQLALWRSLRERGGRVTLEHVLSGAGLVRIYDFLRRRGEAPESPALAAELARTGAPTAIARHALERGDALALAALDLFIACYGAAAGDHALNVMARGGVYLAGGIAPGILPRLAAGGFVAAFNDKAAFSEHARRMPVHVIVNERVGLLGAGALAARSALALVPHGALT